MAFWSIKKPCYERECAFNLKKTNLATLIFYNKVSLFSLTFSTWLIPFIVSELLFMSRFFGRPKDLALYPIIQQKKNLTQLKT